jgi:hypothetical protein
MLRQQHKRDGAERNGVWKRRVAERIIYKDAMLRQQHKRDEAERNGVWKRRVVERIIYKECNVATATQARWSGAEWSLEASHSREDYL